MSLQQIILVILSGLGVFHGILIAAILWTIKSPVYLPNRLLSVLMIILSLRIGKSVILEFYTPLPVLYVYLGLCLLMFIGPLFLLYSRKLIRKENVITKTEWLHFSPGVVFMLLSIVFEKMGFKNLSQNFAIILFATFYTHLIFYLLIVKLKYLGSTPANATSPEIKAWLNVLFVGLIAIWIVYVLNLFEDAIPYIVGPIVYSATVYLITWLAISKKSIQTVSAVKYQTTNIDNDEIELLFTNIESIVKADRSYLNPDLTLGMLSKLLKVSPQKISLVINSKAGHNFNEYINRYRINHAVELINKPESQTLTIAAISFDSGFNSLSSFNTAFKKYTGKTPSAYRKATG